MIALHDTALAETVNADNLSDHQLEKLYRETRAEFAASTKRAKLISEGSAGRYTEDGKTFWASVLFTKLVVTAQSVLRMAPRTAPIPDRLAHWDFSAVASLTRNLAECYFMFFYMCVDETPGEDEWLTRLNLIQLRDNAARRQMFADWNPDDPQLAGFGIHRHDLTQKLRGRKFFQSLPEKRQADLLKGDKALLLTQDEILKRMGEESASFRGMYRLLSAHTHSTPLAFYRMAGDGRGCGVENRADKAEIAVALQMASSFLERAINDMLKIFPDAEQRTSVTHPRISRRKP
jgi:Family of unknown function (DUF5677)